MERSSTHRKSVHERASKFNGRNLRKFVHEVLGLLTGPAVFLLQAGLHG